MPERAQLQKRIEELEDTVAEHDLESDDQDSNDDLGRRIEPDVAANCSDCTVFISSIARAMDACATTNMDSERVETAR